ncbi:hypothetical protein Holit_01209 [Hollandina sp. SP2]
MKFDKFISSVVYRIMIIVFPLVLFTSSAALPKYISILSNILTKYLWNYLTRNNSTSLSREILTANKKWFESIPLRSMGKYSKMASCVCTSLPFKCYEHFINNDHLLSLESKIKK